MTRKTSFTATVIGLFAGAAILSAQPLSRFGVDSVSTLVVTAYDMELSDSAVQFIGTPNVHRYLKSNGGLVGAIHLPQGAVILGIQLESCDTSATGYVSMRLYRAVLDQSVSIALAQTSTGGMPGCGFLDADLAIPEVVDNHNYRYYMIGGNVGYDGTETIGAVRVYYQLQVSPAPATATFLDVPTSDPAFQFIEALVASGVTAGCGNGNYCPNAPLTRRQMAVFLAKLLGLQWSDGPSL